MSKRSGGSTENSPSAKKAKPLQPDHSSQPTIATVPPEDRIDRQTSSQGDAYPEPQSVPQLESQIFKVLRARSVQHAADVRYWTKQFHPILKRDMHVSSSDIVRMLLDDPLSVSNLQLSQILRLCPCTDETPAQTEVSCVYYIRTFPLRKSQLETILAAWETANKRFDVMQYWGDRIAMEKKDRKKDSMFYIRYIGMTAREGFTGFDRYQQDLKGRKSGVLAEFLTEVLNTYPDVQCEVHELVDASYPDFFAPEQTVMDERERILIALFDRNFVLNQQGGGHYPAYIPRAADHVLFATIGTKFFDTYGQMIGRADQIEIVGAHRFVDEWGDNVMNYAQQNPIETLSNTYPLTEEYVENVLKRQALPGLIHGASLMALVGKDVTIQDLVGENTFLSGASRAGRLTVDMIARVHQFEKGFGQPMPNPFFDGQFPFVDVFPWIGRENVKVGLEFVRQYLEGTRPRIVVTFSRLVSSWTASNFVHAWGLPHERILEHVGQPSIAYFDDPKWTEIESSERAASNTAFIQIAHIHPGRDKYGKQPESLRRVFLLTWMATVTVGQYMLEALSAVQRDVDEPREEMCKAVIERFNTEAAPLVEELKRAKSALDADWQLPNYRKSVLSPERRSEISTEIVTARLKRNELALGEPRSETRDLQVKRLWKKNMPDLHLHISREKKDDWIKWAMKLKEGKSFFASSLANVDAAGRVVKVFAPPGVNLNDPEVRKQAFKDAGKRLQTASPEEHYSSEKQRARALGGEAPPAFEDCERAEATVWAKGTVRFYWKHPSGRVVAFTIPGYKKWAPKDKDDKRYISFTAEGLNLLDNFEKVMLKPRATKSPTWTIEDMKKFEQREDMRLCWEQHTEEDWGSDEEEELADDYAALPKSFFEPKGPPPLTLKQTDLTAYAQPPMPGDGTWIIHEFLKEFLGDDGGAVLTGNIEGLVNYSSKHLFVQLKNFIAQPKYFHYPWKSEWVEMLVPNKQRGRLRKNLTFCRDIVKETTLTVVATQSPDGKQKSGIWWEIGPKKKGW